jgi:hypothetical protein
MSAALTALVRASSFIGNVTSDTSSRFLMVLMVRRGSFGLVPRMNSPTIDALARLGVGIDQPARAHPAAG